MKNKKLTTLIIATAILANAILLGLANAEDTTSQVEIIGGSVTMEVPASLNFDSISTSAADQIIAADGTENSFFIEDLTSDGSTWDIDIAIAGPFINHSTGTTIPLGILNSRVRLDFDRDDISWSDLGTSSGCGSAGITLLGTLGRVGLHTTANVDAIEADSTRRAVKCGLTPSLDMKIPGGTAAGTYQSTLVFTLTT